MNIDKIYYNDIYYGATLNLLTAFEEKFGQHNPTYESSLKTLAKISDERFDDHLKYNLSDDFKYLVHSFCEVNISLHSMLHLLVFIDNEVHSYNYLSLMKFDYYKFIFENFFHEYYIYKERWRSFLEALDKNLGNKRGSNIGKIKKEIEDELGHIKKYRNYHIHSKRFFSMDIKDLNDLQIEISKGKEKNFKHQMEDLTKDFKKDVVGIISKEIWKLIQLQNKINGEILELLEQEGIISQK